MLAILNSLNAPNFHIFQPILMILVHKFMVQRALSDKTYLSLGLLSPSTSYFCSPLEDLTKILLTIIKSICKHNMHLFLHRKEGRGVVLPSQQLVLNNNTSIRSHAYWKNVTPNLRVCDSAYSSSHPDFITVLE